MATSVAELCQQHSITLEQLVERSGLPRDRVTAILLRRWTPSPSERQKIAQVFGLEPTDVVFGHHTPIQHIYGQGPG